MRSALAPTTLLILVLCGGCGAGNSPSQFEAGMKALREGNYAEAYCRWRPLAERGYAEAQYHLGWLFANGNGMSVDIEQALAWWGEAARQGHADAQFAVGLAYTTGEGMKKDLDEAINWYLAAARQGHQDARDILVQLNGDSTVHLLERHPEILGWLDCDRQRRSHQCAGRTRDRTPGRRPAGSGHDAQGHRTSRGLADGGATLGNRPGPCVDLQDPGERNLTIGDNPARDWRKIESEG